MYAKLSLLLLGIVLLLSSCNKRDKVVAQVYYHKLYESEIKEMMPLGLSPTDSMALVQDYIDHWIKEKLVIHEAEKRLTPREKNFDRSIEKYRNNLLINAYYDKLMQDTNAIQITEKELKDFTKSFDKRYTIDKEIVKANYVKLSKKSRLIEPIKSILFDENRRVSEKEVLVKLLGDSVEYLIDDEAWLYLDDIQNELSFEIPESTISEHKHMEKEVGNYHYLVVILDYKNQRSVNETTEEQAAAKMMLLNHRKQEYIKQNIDDLYKKALQRGDILQ